MSTEGPAKTSAQDQVATRIYQRHLDVTSRLLLEGDATGISNHMELPYIYRTAKGETVNETLAEQASDTLAVAGWLRSNGATEYFRIAKGARFIDDDTIEGVHVTYALRGAISVIAPYASRVFLRRDGEGRWRAARSEHELTTALFDGLNVKPAPKLFSSEWTNHSAASPVDQKAALKTYKRLLSALDQAVMDADFEAWCALHVLPFTVHYQATDHYISAYDQSRPVFGAMVDIMKERDAERICRTASRAEYVSADKIVGYHESTLVRGGKVIFGPIKARMVIVRDTPQWRVTSVSNSLHTNAMPGTQFQIAEELPTLREIEKRTHQ